MLVRCDHHANPSGINGWSQPHVLRDLYLCWETIDKKILKYPQCSTVFYINSQFPSLHILPRISNFNLLTRQLFPNKTIPDVSFKRTVSKQLHNELLIVSTCFMIFNRIKNIFCYNYVVKLTGCKLLATLHIVTLRSVFAASILGMMDAYRLCK